MKNTWKKALKRYVENIHGDLIETVKENGISALETAICKIYEKEKASEAISTELKNDILTVNVKYYPTTKYLKSIA